MQEFLDKRDARVFERDHKTNGCTFLRGPRDRLMRPALYLSVMAEEATTKTGPSPAEKLVSSLPNDPLGKEMETLRDLWRFRD